MIIEFTVNTEHPENRTGWKHPNIEAYAWSRRGDLIWAALTLTRAWIAAGRSTFTARTLGSFEQWAETIGGILTVAGYDTSTDFLGNLTALQTESDPAHAAWLSFTSRWLARHNTKWVTASELADMAMRVPELRVKRTDGGFVSVDSLGRLLNANRKRLFGGIRINRQSTRNGYEYSLEVTDAKEAQHTSPCDESDDYKVPV